VKTDLQTYQDVKVSDADPGFSSGYANINPRFLADWIQLFESAVQACHPGFQFPPLPAPLKFKTEMIHSDGPYSATENYYTLDYNSIVLMSDEKRGLRISFEDGRQGGGEPICLETIGISPNFSAYIHSPKVTATFYLWHDPSRRPEFEALFNQ